MATAQDIVDALNRLTAAMQALQAQQTAQQQAQQQAQANRGPKATAVQNLGRAWNYFRQAKQQLGGGRYQNAVSSAARGARLMGRAAGGKKTRLGRFLTKLGTVGRSAKAAGAIGGAVAGVGAIITYVRALDRFKRHVERATDALVEAQRKLAEVSPSMAAVYARREVQEILRDRRRGEALAESANYLVGAEQRRKDSWMPLETAWDQLQNRLYGFFNDVVSGMGKALSELALMRQDDEEKKDLALTTELEKIRDAEKQRLLNERARMDRVAQQAERLDREKQWGR
ncbi:MAG TPA: hypothetical protein VEI97_08050 [bacterium]|nr:hypothetical protein [bacterium]